MLFTTRTPDRRTGSMASTPRASLPPQTRALTRASSSVPRSRAASTPRGGSTTSAAARLASFSRTPRRTTTTARVPTKKASDSFRWALATHCRVPGTLRCATAVTVPTCARETNSPPQSSAHHDHGDAGKLGLEGGGKGSAPSSRAPSVCSTSTPRIRSLTSGRNTPNRLRLPGGASATRGAGVAPKHHDEDLSFLHASGLHTSMWAVSNEGRIEVRSMADLSYILNVIERRSNTSLPTCLLQVDQRHVAVGHSDGSLRYLSATSMEELAAVSEAHAGSITCLRSLRCQRSSVADGAAMGSNRSRAPIAPEFFTMLLTSSLDGRIGRWDASRGLLCLGYIQSSMPSPSSRTRGITCMAVTDNGMYVVCGREDGSLHLWPVKEEEPVVELDAEAKAALTAQASGGTANGRWAATPSSKNGAGTATAPTTPVRGPSSNVATVSGLRTPTMLQRMPGAQLLRGSSPSIAMDDDDDEDDEPQPVPQPYSRHPLPPPLNVGGARPSPSTTGARLNVGATDHMTPTRARQPWMSATADMVGGQPSRPPRSSTPGLVSLDRSSLGAARVTSLGGFRPPPSPTMDDLKSSIKNKTPKARTSSAVTTTRRTFAASTPSTPNARGRSGSRAGSVAAHGMATPTRQRRTSQGRGATPTPLRGKSAVKAKKPARAQMSAEQISETVGRVSAFTQSYVCRVVQTSRGRRLTTLHLGTEQEAFTHFSWPIEGAHKAVGGVTGVAVVADRLLISVGRDAAAKVYALPSGTYRRTLRSDRRLPLTAIMVDEARHRVLTGSSDGALAIYDLLDPEMSLLQHVQSGLGVSTFFAPLPHATMNRFLVLHAPTYFTPEDEVALMTEMQPIESSSGKDDSSMLIPYSTSATRGEKRKGDAGPQRRSGPKAIPKMLMTSVVQFDARGPQGSAVKGSEPLGQPTAAEQSNALKLATLQLESLANRQLIHHARRMGTNEDVHDVRELRKASLLMQRCHHRAFGLRCFFRWQRWAARRTKLLERLTAVEFLRDTAHEAVIHSYFGKWQQFHRERLAEKWRAKIQGIHGRGDVAPSSRNLGAMTTSSHTISVLTVDQALCNARRTKLWHVASFLNLKRNTEQLRCAFQTWSTGVRAKILRERREMAFNRLLLLLSGNHYNTSTLAVEYFARHSVKASRMTRALWLLTLPESHGELGPQQELLCRRYLHSWRRWTEERRREEMAASSWNLVMPLSATLVRTEEIRRRYYLKWLTHACFVVKGSRIEEEAHTLSREWLSLQNAADNPCSFQELQREEEEHQLVLIQLGDDLEAAEAQERHYQHELKSLQVSHALRILLGGYSGSLVSSGEDGTSAYMGGGGGYDSTPRRHHQRLTSGGSSPCSSVSNFRPLRQALMVDADDDFRSGPSVATGNGLASLRFDPSQVVAALRVLKAYTLNFGREERPFATAHALALKLPIPEPIGGEVAELNNSQGSVSLMSGGGARPSAGSIHPRVRSTGSWSVTMTSGAAAAPHSAFPTSAAAAALGRGRGSTGRSSGNAPSSATAATLSPAAMWSSAPAERSYASLADAFDATVQQLLQGLADAAREAGLELDDCILRLSEAVVASHVGTSTVEGGDGRTTPTRSTRSSRPRPVTEWMTSEAMDCNQTLPQPRQLLPAAYATSVESDAHRRPPSADSAVVDPSSSIPSWVRQFSPKVRKDLLPLVARLVTLADSYTAHSEATLESSGGTISTRGAASVRPLPLVCLCGERWAQELLRYAPVLLLVLSPKVWTRQLYLQRLQQLADTSVQEDDRCSSIPDASFRTRSIASDGPTRPGNMSHYEWDTPADFRPSPAANRPTPRRLSSELLQRPASMSVLHQIDERESSLGVTSQASYHIPPPPAPQWPEHLPPPTFSGGGNPIHPHHHHHRTMYSYSKPGSVQVEDDVDDDRSVKSMSVRSFSVASTGGSMSVTPRSMTPGGTISRPYLGFRVSVSRDGGGRSVISIKEIAGSFLNAEGKEAEGPAAAANLRVGDHLHRFAGYAVTDLAAFNAIVTRHVRPGVELPMVIIRDGESIPLTIRVGQRLG